MANNNPLDPAFWAAEENSFWAILGPLLVEVVLHGAEGGVMALPADVAVFMNWDVFNQAAIDYLRKYRLTWLKGVSDTTRAQMVGVIQAWIESGEPLPVLEARLTALDAVNASRAHRIAVTEVTRAYAEGNLIAWRSTGFIGGKQWQTAKDELVCPICAPLHGMIVELDGNGFTTESGGLGIQSPPAHPGCRCWLQPIVSVGAFEEELARTLEAE